MEYNPYLWNEKRKSMMIFLQQFFIKMGASQPQPTKIGFRKRIKSKFACFEQTDVQNEQFSIRKQVHEMHYSYSLINLTLDQLPKHAPRCRFLLLDTEIRGRIACFLELHEVSQLQATCRKLKYEKMVTSTYCQNHLKRKWKDLSDLASKFLYGSKHTYSSIFSSIKSLDRVVYLMKQDHVQTKCLRRINLLVVQGILTNPQLTTIKYFSSESDFVATQYQERMQRTSRAAYIDGLVDDCMLKLEDGDGLIELRHAIVSDYITASALFMDGQDCPQLINLVHGVLHSVFLHCQWVKELIELCEDAQQRLALFVVFWRMFQASTLQLCRSFEGIFASLDKVCDNFFGTISTKHHLESNMARIWCHTTQNLMPGLNKTFVLLLTKTRHEALQKPSYMDTNEFAQMLELLQNYQSLLTDLSTNAHSVHWLGHSQFPASENLKYILKETHDSLAGYFRYMTPDVKGAYQSEALQIFNQDLHMLTFIYPAWLIEAFIQAPILELIESKHKPVVQKCESFIEESDPKPGDPKSMTSELLIESPHPSISTQTGSRISQQLSDIQFSSFKGTAPQESNASVRDRITQRDEQIMISNQFKSIPLVMSQPIRYVLDNNLQPKLEDIFPIYSRKQVPTTHHINCQFVQIRDDSQRTNLADLINSQIGYKK